MKLLAALLAGTIAFPAPTFAQFARSAPVRVQSTPVVVAPLQAPQLAAPSFAQLPLGGVPSLTAPNLPSVMPTLNMPAPQVRAAAAAQAAAVAAQSLAPSARATPKAEAKAPLAQRIQALSQAAAKDLQALPAASTNESHAAAETGFARLIGVELAGRSAADAALPIAAPSRTLRSGLARPSRAANKAAAETAAPAPDSLKNPQVRWYLAGTALFKVGMEALGLAVPLIALTVFGQATMAAALAMGWGLSQIVGSSVGGGLLDRKAPAKVLKWSMGLQALSVGTLLSLFVVQSSFGIPLALPAVIFGLHVVTGVLAGVADTARQVIPPLLVGSEGKRLKVFNSKVHVAYEVAGVAGALLTGVLISAFGLVPALILHPPAYLLAAWAFSRLKLADNPAAAAAAPAGNLLESVKRAWADLKAGFVAVKGSKVVFWAAVALVLPLVLHRLLEGLLVPIAAKTLLGAPSVAAWIIAASNFGELMGAFFLMKANMSDAEASKLRSPFFIRLMAAGVLALWVLNFAPSFWFILPAVAFGSFSWAASDLSLRSKIQETLPPAVRGRAFGFLTAAAFAVVLAASFGLGLLFDALPAAPVFWGVNAALTLMAVGLFYAAKKLAATYPKKK
ncbi:MAG: MFS transporter [Elusimicrobia bacterium]|nr:MFS transporter [Elusimicrobiota bacterium]